MTGMKDNDTSILFSVARRDTRSGEIPMTKPITFGLIYSRAVRGCDKYDCFIYTNQSRMQMKYSASALHREVQNDNCRKRRIVLCRFR